jgi:hypothetical protein
VHDTTTQQRSSLWWKLGALFRAPRRWLRERRERLESLGQQLRVALTPAPIPREAMPVLSREIDRVFDPAVTKPGLPPFAESDGSPTPEPARARDDRSDAAELARASGAPSRARSTSSGGR